MNTLFLKITIKKTDVETEQLRNEGLLFSNIADAININRNSIEEIDETNYKNSINLIKKKYNDKRTRTSRTASNYLANCK